MTAPIAGAPSPTGGADAKAERLRGVARDLEGVFVEQLFKAMRETVPDGGVVDGGSGEEMFTGLLDQKMSALAPDQWERGLSDALYRQLRGRVGVGEESGGGVSRPDTPTPDFRQPVHAPILSPSTPTRSEPT
jgi:flagellar protein FlgJ